MQDAVKGRNQYNIGIAAEDGGNVYGGNGFEKDGDGPADHIKMDAAGGADAPETGTWDSKTVPVAACTCCKGCTDNVRCRGGQTVRESPSLVCEVRSGISKEKCSVSLYLSIKF